MNATVYVVKFSRNSTGPMKAMSRVDVCSNQPVAARGRWKALGFTADRIENAETLAENIRKRGWRAEVAVAKPGQVDEHRIIGAIPTR